MTSSSVAGGTQPSLHIVRGGAPREEEGERAGENGAKSPKNSEAHQEPEARPNRCRMLPLHHRLPLMVALVTETVYEGWKGSEVRACGIIFGIIFLGFLSSFYTISLCRLISVLSFFNPPRFLSKVSFGACLVLVAKVVGGCGSVCFFEPFGFFFALPLTTRNHSSTSKNLHLFAQPKYPFPTVPFPCFALISAAKADFLPSFVLLQCFAIGFVGACLHKVFQPCL